MFNFRSTKSEKMYPSMLSRGPDVEIEPYYCLPVGTISAANPVPWSQPTSPTPPNRSFGGPLSPTHQTHRLIYPKKNDDGIYFRFFIFFVKCSHILSY